jgi:hypothetical protein
MVTWCIVGYDVECLHVERNMVGLVVGIDYIVVYDDKFCFRHHPRGGCIKFTNLALLAPSSRAKAW